MAKKIITPSDITITTEDAAGTIDTLRRASKFVKGLSRGPVVSLCYDLEAQANTLQDYIDTATEATLPDPDAHRE